MKDRKEHQNALVCNSFKMYIKYYKILGKIKNLFLNLKY